MNIPFDLPTFPIASGMHLGKRTFKEHKWLLERGDHFHYNKKHIIRKVHDNHYQLLRNTAPIPVLEAEARTLDELVKLHDLPIMQFQWMPHWNEESA